MEITLNLVPPRLLRQQAEHRRRRQRLWVLAVAVLPILLAYMLLNVRIGVLRAQVANLNKQIAPMQPLAAKERRLEDEIAGFRRRQDALAHLTVAFPRWSAILVQLSGLVPHDVWLTDLSVANGQLIVHGGALSEAAVSTMTTRLSGAAFLTGTSLKFIHQDTVGTRRTFTFEIAGTLRPQGGAP